MQIPFSLLSNRLACPNLHHLPNRRHPMLQPYQDSLLV